MWKKLGVTLIALLSTFSVVYAMNREMNAAPPVTYNAGGNVTGRVGDLTKGDTVYLYTSGYEMQLVVNKLPDKDPQADPPISPAIFYPETVWYTLSNKIDEKVDVIYDAVNGKDATGTACLWTTGSPSTTTKSNSYECSNLRKPVGTANNALDNRDRSLIMSRPIYLYYSYAYHAVYDYGGNNNKLFLLHHGELTTDMILSGVTGNDLAFKDSWLGQGCYSSPNSRWIIWDDQTGKEAATAIGGKGNIRYSAFLKLDNVVFSMSNGASTNIGEVKPPELKVPLYTSIGKTMKVRFKDTNLTMNFNQFEMGNVIISQAPENSTIDVNADALYGTSSEGVNTVSAIIYDSSGEFKYYRPMESAKGSDKYEFNLQGIPVGSYQIGFVNEVYDETKNSPTTSSEITPLQPMEILKVHKLSYTSTPKNQPTYEYDKNVEAGNKIGSFTRTDGIVPIHYELVADGSDTTFQNFEISGLDPSGNSSLTSLDVRVKSSGAPNLVSSTNSLKAGTYKFCVVSVDANGFPSVPQIGTTKFCTSLIVDKTTTTISLNTTTQKDIKIGDSVFTDTITTSNQEFTTSDITYGLSGGIPSILTPSTNGSDPLKYDLSVASTHTGIGLPTTFTLQASIKETANYLPATTTVNRPIFVYKELSGLTWTANKGSYSSSDVSVGKTIGDLLAKDGVGPYDYELTTSSDPGNATDGIDNRVFTIANGSNVAAGTKVNVNTSSNLSVGTYKIQFKVTDKGKGTVVYTTATITVSAQAQSKVYFTDSAGVNDITGQGITMKVNDANISLIAKGGSVTSQSIEYYVAAKADQPNQIDPSLYLDVNQSSGLLRPKKVGTIRVYATRPGDGNFGSANSAFMDVTIQPAEQSIAFDIATNPNRVGKGNTILEKATGTVTKTNAVGVGGITYSSSDTTIATIDASGNVTGISAGIAIITATLNDPSSSTYDANYETQPCQKTITVYNAMTLNWTAKTPNLKAESSITGDSAGSVSATSNTGSVRYSIPTNTGITENADGGLFSITANGNVQLKNKVTALALDAHGSNTYKVRVEAIDNNNVTTIIDITITIDDATNTPHFTDSSGNVITSIIEVYGENANSFQLYSTTSNGITAAYQLDPSDTSGTISVNGLGQVTVHKVGSGSAQLIAPAGTGYDGATLPIPVMITLGNQAISFVDTTTVNQQFVAGSTFADPAKLVETSANTTSARTITYTSTTQGVCTIDAAGTITMVTTGSCIVTAENKDANWQPVTTSKTIELFTGMGVSFTQSNTPQAETATAHVGSSVGSLTVHGGSGTKSYAKSTTNNPQNIDASFFSINNSGVISLAKAINASDIASRYDTIKQAYIMHVQFETSDPLLGNKVTTNAEVKIKGAPLNAKFDRVVNGKITQTYSPNGTFTIQLSSNLGNGLPSYQIKYDPTQPNDVLIGVSGVGLVSIDNANDRTANPKPVMVEAIIPPNNGYDSETIEIEVEIIKANQPSFGFANTTIQMPINSTLTPIVNGQLSTGTITITSMDPTALLVSGNDIVSNTIEDTVTIIASDTGDRNYNIASNQATVTISSAPAYPFTIGVPPATYGDTGLKANIVVNGGGANKVQTWVSSDTSIADIDASGNITIYNAGRVNITCTQITAGEPSVSSTAVLTVKPKPITITINNKSKYVGESVPVYDMTIPSGVLVGSDTISLPVFDCVDTLGATVINTTPAGSYPITGTYTTGANPNYAITVTPGSLTVNQDSSLASWYHLEGVTSGATLNTSDWHKEDVKVVLDTATDTAGTYDEISLDQTLWDPTSITLTNEDENSEDVYFRINANGILSTSQSTIIKIDKTNPVIKSITGTQTNKSAASTLINNLTFGAFFKPGTKVSILSEDILPTPTTKVSGLQDVSYEVYEIDRATGIIGATPIDLDTKTPDATGNVEVILSNTGLYRVCAIVKDNAGNISAESCSDLNVKKVDIDIDNDSELEFQDPDKDGCPDINIALQDAQSKIYKINVDRDGDGIPDLNIDSDGDGLAEINVDSDNDGKPDLNLVILTTWIPTFCVTGQKDNEGNVIEYCTMKGIKPVINVDTGNDGQPDVDIDTNGDMKPDYNITKDGKTPIINIGPVHPWDPKTDYDSEGFAYDSIKKDQVTPQLNIDTDGDGRPDVNLDPTNSGEPTLNIDVDGDGIPDVDIDSDGDGIADINIDEDGNGTADKNIVKITEWLPDHDSDSIKDFPYDTMNTLKLKDTIIDEDSGIQIQKPGGSFLPNHAIKVENIKDTIGKEDKDKMDALLKEDSEIKDIFDVKLTDGTSDIQPDGSIKVRIPLRNDLKDATSVKVILEQLDGTYKEVEATIKDGFIEYETDYLGKVGIVADKVVEEPPLPEPELKPDIPMPDLKPSGSGGSTPDTTVKGNYTQGVGGAGTGDTTVLFPYGISISVALGILLYISRRYRKNHHEV